MAVRQDIHRHENSSITQRPSDTSSSMQFSNNSSCIHKSSSYIIKFLTVLVIVSSCICFAAGLQCIKCEGASSNHECNLNGAVEICRINQQNCHSEIRHHGGIYTIKKGCQQEQSCRAQQLRNMQPLSKYGFQQDWKNNATRCNAGYENSVCHHCCPYNFCNLNDLPIPQSDFSCNQQFPSCRDSKWSQRVGFLLGNNTFSRCYCDLQCRTKGDCCEDHHAVCIGVLPKALRFMDKHDGATGGEYNITLPRGGDLPLLRCISCENELNNKACNRNGVVVECRPNERSCVSEVRTRNGVKRISKYCSQSHSCKSLQTPGLSCNETEEETTCYSCCDSNYCNLSERPHTLSYNSSCLHQFPGFPQCLKPSLARCGESNECSGEKCHCDIDCDKFDDCCDDYDEICRGPPPANLDWIFKEIESLPPQINMDESNLIVIGNEILVEGSSRGRNIFQNNHNSLDFIELTENDT